MIYICKEWKRVAARSTHLDPKFAKHLRQIIRPKQIAYTRLMRVTEGNPVGIECKSSNRDAWAFIVPEVSDGSYAYRVQSFDLDGFCGHFCHATFEDAISDLLQNYREIDSGALDRISLTERWKIGVKRSEFRLLFDQGVIDFRQYLEKSASLTN